MEFFVHFWGTRGSIPTPGSNTKKYGGNTSCIELRVDGTRLICDGGTGLRELGLEMMQGGEDPLEAHMFFSHTHWDHIQGFPFFRPAYAATTTLHVYDIGANDARIRSLLLGQMSSEQYFPVRFSDLGADIRFSTIAPAGTTVDGTRVSCFEQVHPGRSFAYRFDKAGTSVVYATDSELDQWITNPSASEADRDALRVLPSELLRFVGDAELLVADAQYDDEEYPEKIGWGHARANTVVDLAVQAGVRQLALFHHDPMHGDDVVDRTVEQCRRRAQRWGSNLVVFGAREGLVLKL